MTLVHAPHKLPTVYIYTHTNNQQALKSGHLSNELDTLESSTRAYPVANAGR